MSKTAGLGPGPALFQPLNYHAYMFSASMYECISKVQTFKDPRPYKAHQGSLKNGIWCLGNEKTRGNGLKALRKKL
jgi:hypothetical protein